MQTVKKSQILPKVPWPMSGVEKWTAAGYISRPPWHPFPKPSVGAWGTWLLSLGLLGFLR
jgi:hypothetical protein